MYFEKTTEIRPRNLDDASVVCDLFYTHSHQHTKEQCMKGAESSGHKFFVLFSLYWLGVKRFPFATICIREDFTSTKSFLTECRENSTLYIQFVFQPSEDYQRLFTLFLIYFVFNSIINASSHIPIKFCFVFSFRSAFAAIRLEQ